MHSFHKKFSSLRAFVDVDGKIKPCVSCGDTATQEALFTVEGATIIEKYCDSCAKEYEIIDYKKMGISSAYTHEDNTACILNTM